jgi:hypothetical protein|tara:strand:- start:4597 stop:5031 length:435 start_codon:yes stop_codon:yes gene_type:complete
MARAIKQRTAVRNDQQPFQESVIRLGGDNTAAFTRAITTLPFNAEIVGVDIFADTEVTEHAANYWTFSLQAGATVLASTDTETGEGGTLSAESARALDLTSTIADRDVANGTMLTLVGTPATAESGADLSAVSLGVIVRYQPVD